MATRTRGQVLNLPKRADINLRDRFENMPVGAMFPGPGKPPSVTVILECLKEQFVSLDDEGFNAKLPDGSTVRVRARLAFVMADSPGTLQDCCCLGRACADEHPQHCRR